MKWLHNLLKGASLTTALFIFQACYGTVPGPLWEEGTAPMSFTLLSGSTGEPLEGIQIRSKVTRENSFGSALGVTGQDGRCDVSLLYFRNAEGPFVRFEDPEGRFQVKDTVLFDLRERNIVVSLSDTQL